MQLLLQGLLVQLGKGSQGQMDLIMVGAVIMEGEAAEAVEEQVN